MGAIQVGSSRKLFFVIARHEAIWFTASPFCDEITSYLAMTECFSLVPKLHLGTHLGAKFYFANARVWTPNQRTHHKGAKCNFACNFACNCVTKYKFVTSPAGQLAGTTRSQVERGNAIVREVLLRNNGTLHQSNEGNLK